MQASGKRIAAFDIAKGLAILLVVYAHGLRGLGTAGVIPTTSPLFVSDYVIYTFHMPLFFAISGYFLDRNTGKGACDLWSGRLRTVAYPYFFWSLIHGGILYAASRWGVANTPIGAERLAEIGWNPISPYWFLYALLFCYLLAAVFRTIDVGLIPGPAFVAFLASFHVEPQVVNDMFYGWLYFSLGLLVREKRLLDRLPSSLPSVVMLWASFALVAALSYRIGIPERLPFGAAILGCAATMASCFYLERRFPAATLMRVLEILGQCSMGIFVMHIIVLGSMRVVLMHVLGMSDPLAVLFVSTLAGVLVPVAAQIAAIRMNVQDIVALPSSARVFGINRRFAWKKGPAKTGLA